MATSLSLIAFFVFLVATLPQVYQTIQTRMTRDLNGLNLLLNLLGNTMLGIHGFYTRDFGLIGIGVYFTFYWSFLIYYKLSEQNNQENRKQKQPNSVKPKVSFADTHDFSVRNV